MKLLRSAIFPNENPIGKHITPGACNHGKPQPREIVGIVGNVKSQRLDVEDRTEYYIPDTQLNFGSMAVCLAYQRRAP